MLPRDLLIDLVERLALRDAAAFACVNRGANDAYRRSRAFHAVRVAGNGRVLEPASGAFDVTVEPGPLALLAAALARCPRGGSVLLLPGTHGVHLRQGPWYPKLRVGADDEVHVFGRGRAALGVCLQCDSRSASFVGVEFDDAVNVAGGRPRIQACIIARGINCWNGSAPTFDRCHAGGLCNVTGNGTSATFARNTLDIACIVVDTGASATIVDNTFRGAPRCGSATAIRVADGSRSPTAIVGNRIAGYFTAVDVFDTAPPRRRECAIVGNRIHHCRSGVVLTCASAVRIADNETWSTRFAVTLVSGSSATITGNRIRGDGTSRGIEIDDGSAGLVADNEVGGHSFCVFVMDGASPTVERNLFRDSAVGVFLSNAGACAHAPNDARGVWLPVLRRWHLRFAGALLSAASALCYATGSRMGCAQNALLVGGFAAGIWCNVQRSPS